MSYDLIVLGGGITGLAALYEALRPGYGKPPRCLLIDAGRKLGGKVRTEEQDGFVLEAGADSVVPQKPWALELIRELGLEDRLLPSRDERRRTFLVHDGKLVPLPKSLRMFVPTRLEDLRDTGLLSEAGLARVAQEREIPVRDEDSDESVGDFVRRRFGSELLQCLAEPILAHTHVADVERMSLRATYPQLAAMERRHGSLTAAFEHAPEPPKPLFWSLRGGLGELVSALHQQLPAGNLRIGKAIVRISRMSKGWHLRMSSGQVLSTRHVVVALPGVIASELLMGCDFQLAFSLGSLRLVPIVNASFGYRLSDLPQGLDGFGFFVPHREQRRILACSWSSTKFDHRAPPGMALLRVFLGGADGESAFLADEEELLDELQQELGEIMGATAAPVLRRLFHSPSGYPQYDVGHVERIAELEASLPAGLHLAGGTYHGVGLPDCIRSGRNAARAALGRPFDGGVN